MGEPLTWTQFATVMGLLTLVAGVASYFFKQWQESAFGRLEGGFGRLERDAGEIKASVRQLTEHVVEMDKRLGERMARLEGAFEGHLERGA